MIFLELFSFVISSVIPLYLSFRRVPTNVLMQMTAILLVVLLVLIFTQTKKKVGGWVRILMLFLSSLFVQLLVLSSGGVYSPFLIVLHLYTLGISFLFNIRSS